MANPSVRYDAIVFGSGQGGNPLSQKLSGQGLRVALIEARELGGTCINTGCTPTKTMVASAQVAHYARNAGRWGVKADAVTVDLAAVVARKNKVVEEFRSGWQTKVDKQPTLDLHRGVGKFVGLRQIEVNGKVLEAPRVFIDTGTSSTMPPIPGLSAVEHLNNETLMQLTVLPKHLIVIGGGYIGLEFGQMFRRFGSDVTVVQHSAHLLEREDPDVTDKLKEALESEDLRFLMGSEVKEVSGQGESISVHVEGSNGARETIGGSHLLVAAGRHPNTSSLDLEKTGVAVNDHGYIKVNGRLETTAEGIWALGDVTGGPAFTHISYNDFQIVYGNLYENKSLSTDERIVPYAVFTDPQLGRVGMNETQARAAGKSVKVGSVAMTSVARGIERGETKGVMKVVVDASNDLVLGASILAPEGGEVVQILHTLMLARQPYTLLKGAIYIHPTIAEGFFSMLESVQ